MPSRLVGVESLRQESKNENSKNKAGNVQSDLGHSMWDLCNNLSTVPTRVLGAINRGNPGKFPRVTGLTFFASAILFPTVLIRLYVIMHAFIKHQPE